jgi:hypothetical protein
MIYSKVEDVKIPFNEWLRPENIKIIKPEKIEAFEYFVMNIYNRMDKPEKNDLSMIKLQSLLFLAMRAYLKNALIPIMALKNKKDENDIGLLSIFDNWYAMPYGNIEKDIFDYHRKNDGQFNGFKVNVHGLEITV